MMCVTHKTCERKAQMWKTRNSARVRTHASTTHTKQSMSGSSSSHFVRHLWDIRTYHTLHHYKHTACNPSYYTIDDISHFKTGSMVQKHNKLSTLLKCPVALFAASTFQPLACIATVENDTLLR
jgi:hypothetical protein